LVDGVLDALKFIQDQGYKIIVVTNQSGIGRGLYTENQFAQLNNWMQKIFQKNKIDVLDVFYCPHTPEDNCSCRKPKPGLFLLAEKKFQIDMSASWSVGDKETDITAARSAGIRNTVLVRSGHKINEKDSKAKYILKSLKDILNLKI